MAFKKKSGTQSAHYPETIPACYFEKGEFIVPIEHEDYYVRIWKWKLVRFGELDQVKRDYLRKYEIFHGDITHWRNEINHLRPLY